MSGEARKPPADTPACEVKLRSSVRCGAALACSLNATWERENLRGSWTVSRLALRRAQRGRWPQPKAFLKRRDRRDAERKDLRTLRTFSGLALQRRGAARGHPRLRDGVSLPSAFPNGVWEREKGGEGRPRKTRIAALPRTLRKRRRDAALQDASAPMGFIFSRFGTVAAYAVSSSSLGLEGSAGCSLRRSHSWMLSSVVAARTLGLAPPVRTVRTVSSKMNTSRKRLMCFM